MTSKYFQHRCNCLSGYPPKPRLFLEYGYGRPAAELDRERLDMDRERLEMDKKRSDLESGEKSIKIVLSDELRELAK